MDRFAVAVLGTAAFQIEHHQRGRGPRGCATGRAAGLYGHGNDLASGRQRRAPRTAPGWGGRSVLPGHVEYLGTGIVRLDGVAISSLAQLGQGYLIAQVTGQAVRWVVPPGTVP
jgi:hypothetical protein